MRYLYLASTPVSSVLNTDSHALRTRKNSVAIPPSDALSFNQMDQLERAGITVREREVLFLLGQRLTNAEIGERLFISVRTVESHVSSLLRKLGADSRLDLAEYKAVAALRGFPVPTTRLIGRESQLKVLRDQILSSRLVTLTGSGGSGKTRMAIAVATSVAEDFSDGAVFLDCSALSDPLLVASTLAGNLGVQLGGGSTTLEERDSEIVALMSDYETLVVFDNCEHLLEPVSHLISRLIQACPGVRVLATSREAFGLPGENIHVVPPLQLPQSLADSERAEAVVLFRERAKALRSDLDLVGADAEAAISICTTLDGLPLAIELAAVQLVHLTPAEVVRHLNNRFNLLTGRRSDTPRQATLKATIDWSYDLLTDEEQTLFARLGIFVGWFSGQAASSVCMVESGTPLEFQSLIGGLIWKSLLSVSTFDSSSRYRMLESVRAYAEEKLYESGEHGLMSRRHCQWCIDFAEDAAPNLIGEDRATWLRKFHEEIPNLRSGLAWAISNNEADMAAALFAAMWRYWHMHGDIAEGRRRGAEVLEMPGMPDGARARSLEAAGGLAWWGGDMDASSTVYEEALLIARSNDDPAVLANALYNAAFPNGYGGRGELALAYLEEARAIYENLGDELGIAKCVWGWGACAQAMEMNEEARSKLEQALQMFEPLDDVFMLAWAHRMLGSLLLRLGQLAEAKPHLEAGLRLFDSAGDISGIVLHLRDFAQMAIDQGDSRRAMVLIGALGAIQETSGIDLVQAISQEIKGLEGISEELGPIETETLLRQGHEMTRDEAIGFATDQGRPR